MSRVNYELIRSKAMSQAEDASSSHDKQHNDSYLKEKEQRIQACIKQFNDKCETLIAKYFDENNPKSINRSLERAAERHGAKNGKVELYMNFERSDFQDWSKFVPYKRDEYGRNYNARPASCLNLFLQRAQYLNYLPNITFDVWGNQKFTVKFTMDLQIDCSETDKNNNKSSSSS